MQQIAWDNLQLVVFTYPLVLQQFPRTTIICCRGWPTVAINSAVKERAVVQFCSQRSLTWYLLSRWRHSPYWFPLVHPELFLLLSLNGFIALASCSSCSRLVWVMFSEPSGQPWMYCFRPVLWIWFLLFWLTHCFVTWGSHVFPYFKLFSILRSVIFLFSPCSPSMGVLQIPFRLVSPDSHYFACCLLFCYLVFLCPWRNFVLWFYWPSLSFPYIKVPD